MNLKKHGFSEINHNLFTKTDTPYKIYAEYLEDEAQQQFFDVLSQPYVTYGALMPDAHTGYSMPIGGVCATKDVIVPQFVGFDIGCGMCAYKTDFTKGQIETRVNKIYNRIKSKIPMGFKTHKKPQSVEIELPKSSFAKHILETIGEKQIGTLGSGNHFVEVGYGADDRIWIIVHSGSRGLGHKIASHYMLEAYLQENPIDKQAKKINIDNIKGIYSLDVNSELGRDYIRDQNFVLAYALENRKRMIETVHDIINGVVDSSFEVEYNSEERFINRNHNHAEYDHKRDEWIHRKGATHAQKGMRGVVPANMRDGSFIVIGKGNPSSLSSSSHGAGRVMSRKQARESISLDEFKSTMKGVRGTIDKNTLDESPFAYKDIFEVMRLQEDLVEVEEHVRVLVNVKDNSRRGF